MLGAVSLHNIQGSKVSEYLVRCTVCSDTILIAYDMTIMKANTFLFTSVCIILFLCWAFRRLREEGREGVTVIRNRKLPVHTHTLLADISAACTFNWRYRIYEAPKNAHAAPVAMDNILARRFASGLASRYLTLSSVELDCPPSDPV